MLSLVHGRCKRPNRKTRWLVSKPGMKMSKAEAIKVARADVNEYTTWDASIGMWRDHGKKFSKSELKLARIKYAASLLGIDSYDIWNMNCNYFYGKTFVQAVYSL